MPKIPAATKQSSLDTLRSMLSPGDTVYTVLRHVSSSGMSRSIDCYVMRDNAPVWLSRHIANATGMGWDAKREAVKVGGCGMDMGFHIVWNVGACLWPKGTDTPHGTRNGEPDSEGGYALKHRWM